MQLLGERLKQLLDELRISQTQFSLDVGISKNATTSIIRNRSLPRADILQRFLTQYKNVNANWLMTGTGDMFLSRSINDQVSQMVEQSELQEIRVINTEQRSAYKRDHGDEDFLKRRPVEYRKISKKGVYRKFEVYDDSMDDEEYYFPEGSMLLCRKIEAHLWTKLQRGDLFVIVGPDFSYGFRQVRAITPTTMLLHPFNDYYEEQELEFEKVSEIWLYLERSIRRENLDYKLTAKASS